MFVNDNISQRNKSLNPPRQLHLLLTVSVDVGGKNSSLTVVSFICLYEQLLCLLLPLWWLLSPETLKTSHLSIQFISILHTVYTCMSYNPCGSLSLSVYDINYLHLSFCRRFGQSNFQWSTTETITYWVSDTFAFSQLYIWNDHREVRSYDIFFLCAFPSSPVVLTECSAPPLCSRCSSSSRSQGFRKSEKVRAGFGTFVLDDWKFPDNF